MHNREAVASCAGKTDKRRLKIFSAKKMYKRLKGAPTVVNAHGYLLFYALQTREILS